jgi:hypothetical protein
MKRGGRRACLALFALTVAWPAFAHHSASMFEPKKTVTLSGVVKEFQYTNPHSWLIIAVTNADGTVTLWGFESEGPSTLLRAGIHRGDLAPGTKVTVTGRPMRDGRPAATWEKAVRADGKVFDPNQGLENNNN